MRGESSIGALSLVLFVAVAQAAQAEPPSALRMATDAPLPAQRSQSLQGTPDRPAQSGAVDLRFRPRDGVDDGRRRDLADDPRRDRRYGAPEAPVGPRMRLKF